MADRKEAINCIQDLIDVANSHGSAYVYKHNGGVDQLENVLACLKENWRLLVSADRVTVGDVTGKFFVSEEGPAADGAYLVQEDENA